MTSKFTPQQAPVFRPGDEKEQLWNSGLYDRVLAYKDREVPWHMRGVAIKSGVGLMEMARQANVFLRIVQARPNAGFSVLDDDGKPTGEQIGADQVDEERITDYTVMKAPHLEGESWEPLGVSSSRYSLIQNETLCRMLVPLEKYGEVDTMGVLRKGALFFVSFIGNKWAAKINGESEEHQTYLVVKNSHLPGEALQFQIVFIRTVCMNTWRIGNEENLMDLSLPHTGDVQKIASFLIDALAQVPERQESAKKTIERLGQMKGERADYGRFLLDVIPDPAEPEGLIAVNKGLAGLPELEAAAHSINTIAKNKSENYRYQLERATYMRQLSMACYDNSPTVHRDTKLGYVEALTEAASHGLDRSGVVRRVAQRSKESVLWGEKNQIIQKGYELALSGEYGNKN